MADNKKLDSIIQIDGENYDVIAETAKKVENKLTINVINGTTTTYEFDGSAAKEINLEAVDHAGDADYAKEAGKVTGTLTINVIEDGKTTPKTFNGSEDQTITVGDANKIKVNMDNGKTAYATITISANDPTAEEGSAGNIWFKFN